MSRPTTSQIIAKGDYLLPDFDPKTLTIPHLIGIFAYHQIQYPSQHNKAKLVEVFDDEIKRNSQRLRRQRLERQATLASEDGIVDGVTGNPIVPVDAQPIRRSSRRLSREPSAEPTRTEPPKRRRASAEPTVGRARKSTPKQVEVISEESEEEQRQPQPKLQDPSAKVGKRKGSEAAGSSRRVSQKFGPGTDDSGWEDNNVFQSGAESSSPVRPPRTKAPRKSNLRKRSSLSAPPETPPSPSKAAFSPPHFNFFPELPSIEVKSQRSRLSTVKLEPLPDDYYDDVSGLADVSAAIVVEEDDTEEDEQQQYILPQEKDEEDREREDGEAEFEDPQTVAVAQRIAEGGTLVRRRPTRTRSSLPLWQKIFSALLLFSLSSLAALYKSQSAPIGYCDTGLQTNDALLELRNKRQQVEACYADHSEDGKQDACPPLPLLPLPHPETCTPCPAHASCTRFAVRCDDGYILSPHPLSRISYLPELANGLPGFGPIAFPPRCVDDELRKKHIGRLGKAIDTSLAETKGNRICAGIDSGKPIDGGEARKWGYGYEDLKESLYKKEQNREDGKSIAEFDAMYQEAIEQLMKYGRIIQEKDSNGKAYIASDHSDMTWSCRAIVAARHSWAEWRRSVFGTIGLFLFGLYGKAQLAARREGKQRVAELVQLVLEELRNQEMQHHVDPVTTPQAYISSVQLRDLILQDEHHPQARRRLWEPVERIIEGNTNVRVSLEELRGGEEGRVWTWVGSSGLASPSKKRVTSPSQSPLRE